MPPVEHGVPGGHFGEAHHAVDLLELVKVGRLPSDRPKLDRDGPGPGEAHLVLVELAGDGARRCWVLEVAGLVAVRELVRKGRRGGRRGLRRVRLVGRRGDAARAAAQRARAQRAGERRLERV